MPSDPKSHARAAVLAGALVSSPLPEAELVPRVRVPAIRLTMRRSRPPIYRYRVASDGAVSVRRDPVGGRACHVRHRAKSASSRPR
jgi:hypothetical protein